MPIKTLHNFGKHVVKTPVEAGKVFIEKGKFGIPDPCIRVRKGAGTQLVKMLINPVSLIELEVSALVKGKKGIQKESKLRKLRKAKKVKVCLF